MYNFTPEDLLQYLYKETSIEKTAAIEAALVSDYSLREAMNLLELSHQQLNEVKLVSPRQQTLDNIFSYAEKAIEELHA
jgi:hypothetical protein